MNWLAGYSFSLSKRTASENTVEDRLLVLNIRERRVVGTTKKHSSTAICLPNQLITPKSDPCVTSVDKVCGTAPEWTMGSTGRGSSHFDRLSYQSKVLGIPPKPDTFRNHTVLKERNRVKELNASVHSRDFSLGNKSSSMVSRM